MRPNSRRYGTHVGSGHGGQEAAATAGQYGPARPRPGCTRSVEALSLYGILDQDDWSDQRGTQLPRAGTGAASAANGL